MSMKFPDISPYESNIQLKDSNYAAFSLIHGYAVNNLGLLQKLQLSFTESRLFYNSSRTMVARNGHYLLL